MIIPGSRHLLGLCNLPSLVAAACISALAPPCSAAADLQGFRIDISQSSKVYTQVPETANAHLAPEKALSYYLLSKAQPSAQLQRRCQNPVCFYLMSLCCSGRWDAPRRSLPPKHSLCHTLPRHLVSKPNAASRPSRQRNKPRVVSVTVQRTPFCFLLFLQRARPRPLFPPPPCCFPPALAFRLLHEEMCWICHLCALSPPLDARH